MEQEQTKNETLKDDEPRIKTRGGGDDESDSTTGSKSDKRIRPA